MRDALLGRFSQDIDIMVLGNGIDFAHKVAERLGDNIPVRFFKNFGTAMIIRDGLKIEFVGALYFLL